MASTCSPRNRRSPVASFLLAAAAFFGLAVSGSAYTTEEASWPDGDIVMQLQIGPAGMPLSDGSASLDASAEDCLVTWNQSMQRSKFVVTHPQGAFTAMDGDGINSVLAASTIYGDTFDFGVLAVTLLGYDDSTLFETDVILNTRYKFDSYRGPLHRSRVQPTEDAHRILLHEFGHVLGLDHPDEAGQNGNAIMNSRISDLDALTADDIAGAHYLYDIETPGGGGGNSPASFARINAGKNQIRKILYSPATGNLYTIGRKKGRGVNRLTIYNPYTLEVLDGPDFPHAPQLMAMSDDGRYLYLSYTDGSSGATRVGRMDLFLDVVDQDFMVSLPASAGAGAATPPHLFDMQVAPGEPGILAFSQGYGGEYDDESGAALGERYGRDFMRIYENGVARKNDYAFPGIVPLRGPTIQFAGRDRELLAFPRAGENNVYRFTVDDDGLISPVKYFVSNPASGAFYQYFGGYLYDSLGEQLDAATGEYRGGVSQQNGFNFAINPEIKRIFYHHGASPPIAAYTLPDFTTLGTAEGPAAAKTILNTSFVAWGRHGLAYGAPQQRGLYVARAVTFKGDPLGGATPDTITLKAPASATISQNAPGSLKFRVRRESASGDSSQDVTVRYKLAGTGVNGVNFKPLTGSVVIPARKSQVKFKLRPQPGSITDGKAVTVAISLAADPSYVVAAPAAAAVGITP